ncbi:NAD(P)-dependent oxidoreductase [Demequina sp.]|uniref:NAD(P)-dependent oxidoreductase n=1 Tax=Demequina sp. TaxID=2050685 RepID=UPI003D121710
MSNITVIGGNGYTGAAVVSEAVKRGHSVTVISRSEPSAPTPGVTYVAGSALDSAILDTAFEGADAVVTAVSSRGEAAQAAPQIAAALVERAASSGARVVFVGGFSSLRPAAGEPRFIEGEVPEQYRAEANAGHQSLETLSASAEGVDWVFVSPPAQYGSWIPGEPTGTYRLSDDVAILDENGTSTITGADLALAVLDVIESGDHSREHISVAS